MTKHLNHFAIAALVAFASGCATAGYKQAQTTSTSLQEAAQSIDDTLAPLNAVLFALDDLLNRPGEDLTPQFQSYSAAVGNLETSVNNINRHAQQMRADGTVYFDSWEAEIAKIQSNDIQSRSRERKDEMVNDFRAVSAEYAQTRDELEPFMSDLIDIRTALATDLTSAGLSSLDGLLKSANRDAGSLRDSMVQLSSEFKAMGLSLSPAMPNS